MKESTAQACSRLIAALDDLSAQEAAAIATSDFRAAIDIQHRAAPVVEFLARQDGRALASADRLRLGAIHARRERSEKDLAAALQRARAELAELATHRHCVARVAPVYGRQSPPPSSRFSVSG